MHITLSKPLSMDAVSIHMFRLYAGTDRGIRLDMRHKLRRLWGWLLVNRASCHLPSPWYLCPPHLVAAKLRPHRLLSCVVSTTIGRLNKTRHNVIGSDQRDENYNKNKWRWPGLGVKHIGLNQCSYSTSGPVNTWMGDRLWVGKLSRYVTRHLGQLSLPSLRSRLIEYQPFWLGLGGACSLVSGGRCVIPLWQVTPRSFEMCTQRAISFNL